MKTKIFRIGKRTISVILSLMMVVSIMLVGMVAVNAWTSYYLVGDDFGNWNTNNTSYPVNQSSENGKFYAVVKLTNGKSFKLTDGSNYRSPNTSGDDTLTVGDSGIKLTSGGTDSIKFTGTTGTYKVCIDLNNNQDGTPWLWIENATSTTSDWYVIGHQFDSGWNTSSKSCKMTYDSATGYYYYDKNITSGDNYFRFHDGSKQYGVNSDAQVTVGGSKVSLTETSAAALYTSGVTGDLRFWFDSNTKQTWVTRNVTTYTLSYGVVTGSAGSPSVSVSGTGVTGSSTTGTTTGSIEEGKSVTFTATTANPSYYTFQWYSNSSGSSAISGATSSTYTVSDVTSAESAYVKLTPITYQVKDSGSSTTGGTVTAKVNSATVTSFDAGSTVVLEATPLDTHNLVSFTATCNGNEITAGSDGKITFTNAAADITYTAIFEAKIPEAFGVVKKQDFNVNTGSYGAVSADTSNVSGTVQKSKVSDGKFNLTAVPSNDYYFAGWYSNENCTELFNNNSTVTVTVTDESVTYYALFKKEKPVQYDLTVNAVDNAVVTAKVGSTTIAEGETVKVYTGATVTLTVNTTDGYVVKEVKYNDTKLSAGNYTFTMPATNTTVATTVEYKSTYTLTHSATTGGSVSSNPSTTTDLPAGTAVALTATADSGYTFSHWTVTGNCTIKSGTDENKAGNGLADKNITVTVNGDVTAVANFVSTSSLSSVKLYEATQQSTTTRTLFSTFKETTQIDSFPTYDTVVYLSAKTYYFSVYAMNQQDNGTSYVYFGNGYTTDTDGYAELYHTTNDKNVGVTVAKAGLYRITFNNRSAHNNGSRLYFEELTPPLATSVTLEPKTETIVEDNTIQFTATLNGAASGIEYTYDFYVGSDKVKSITSTDTSVKTYINFPNAGTSTVYVKVSTEEGLTVDSSKITYGSVTSSNSTITVTERMLYISADEKTWSSTYPYTLTVGEGGTGTFYMSENSDGTRDPGFKTNFNVNNTRSQGCTITAKNDEYDIEYFTVQCNPGCENPVIYLDKATNQIYAIATVKDGVELGSTYTNHSNETVTYYFAELADDADMSLSGDGVRIRYFNNSLTSEGTTDSSDENVFVDVTTPFIPNGKSTNEIYVNTEQFYHKGKHGTNQKFKVYKIDLPMWATSFSFVQGSNNNILYTYSNSKSNKAYSNIALNPNRVYLLYKASDNAYLSSGVILDESLWTSESSGNTNWTKTKDFPSYLMDYSSGHTPWETEYKKTSYENTLYFGDFNNNRNPGYYNFKLKNNLAQRGDNNKAFFASVQGLAGTKLSTTYKNSLGNGTLLGSDNYTRLPMFNYEILSGTNSLVHTYAEEVMFPFYESTINGITTYSYDSITDWNRQYDSEEGKYKVTGYASGNDADSTTYTGFFPFGDGSYGFGTEFDIDFYMTDSGKLKGVNNEPKDITFNFSGDDDVWVYIDGVLALDLGGDHKISAGTINFSEMKVYYKSSVLNTSQLDSDDDVGNTFAYDKPEYIKTVDLAKLLSSNGVTFNNRDSSTKHTLQMFYMERGTYQSNCSISFNLPQNSGLKVVSELDVDGVNDAFVDTVNTIANKDYFSYKIENKKATSAEKGAYSGIQDPATSFFTEFLDSNPLYPVTTNNNIVRRVVNGNVYQYLLAVKNTTEGSKSTIYSELFNSSTSYIPLNGVNYSLGDSYVDVVDDNNTPVPGASTDVSGTTKSGIFNLLFGESASFVSKITPNSMVRVVQDNNIYLVKQEDGKAIAAGNDSGRDVSRFYNTEFTVVDDRSHDTIAQGRNTLENGVISAEKSGSDGFYFSNYKAEEATDNVFAMTVTYTNSPIVGDIIINKELTENEGDDQAKFYFNMEFSNVFGDSSDDASKYKVYENLEYYVFDDQYLGTEHETDIDYSINASDYEGRPFTHDGALRTMAHRYIVIKGVPVDTKYRITERTQAGYGLEVVSGKIKDSTGADITADSNISTSLVESTGEIPYVNDGTTATFTYTNKPQAIEVVFKYYDREVISGTVAHIDEDPSYHTVSIGKYSDIPDLNITEGNDGIEYIDFAQVVGYAGASVKVDNVIDTYTFFNSQSEAKTGMSTVTNIITGQPYGAGLEFHTDPYGRPQGSEGAIANDGELWVTYYDSYGQAITPKTYDDDLAKFSNSVAKIQVWMYNTLKEYDINMTTAQSSGDLTSIGNDLYVAHSNPFSATTYFNQRLGDFNDDVTIDSQGAYLKEYGIMGYIDKRPETAEEIGDLQFLYWAMNTGTAENPVYVPVSSQISYGYRITTHLNLYAIYGPKGTEVEPGVSLTKHVTDTYYNNNNEEMLRLNTMLNVYGCPDSDANIKQAAVVYLFVNARELSDDQVSQINAKVKELLAEHSAAGRFTNGQIVVDVTISAWGLVYDIKATGTPTNGTYESHLTNKNRGQFSTSFKASQLKNKRLFTYGAVNYAGEWLVSDNYVDFDFRNK